MNTPRQGSPRGRGPVILPWMWVVFAAVAVVLIVTLLIALL